MELLKYDYFCELKSLIKTGNNKFHNLINAPRIPCYVRKDLAIS